MRLTDEMKKEMFTIDNQIETIRDLLWGNARLDRVQQSRWIFQHGDDLECYKVKLENFYSETDVKEQTFKKFPE